MAAPSDEAAARSAAELGDRYRTAALGRPRLYAVDPASSHTFEGEKRWVWRRPIPLLFRTLHLWCERCGGRAAFLGPADREGDEFVYRLSYACGDDEIRSGFPLLVGGDQGFWRRLFAGETFPVKREPKPAADETIAAAAATLGVETASERELRTGEEAERQGLEAVREQMRARGVPEELVLDTVVDLGPILRGEPTRPVTDVDLQIRVWQLAALLDAEYNPNTMTEAEGEALDDSLDRFGLVEPLVVNVHPDRRGVLVGGHNRRRRLLARGVAEAAAVEVSLDLAAERELNARLNGNRGRLDPRLLVEGGYTREELEEWGLGSDDLAAFDKAEEDLRRAAEDLDAEEEFPLVDPDAPTTCVCPRCGFEWNEADRPTAAVAAAAPPPEAR